MNDLTKNIIADKFAQLVNQSGMKKTAISKRMGFHPTNLSFLKNNRKQIGSSIWNKFQKAINSGDKLIDHLDKYYPIKQDNKDNNYQSSMVKVKPEVLGKREKELTQNESGNMLINRKIEIETNENDVTIRINIDLYINGKRIKFD